MSRQRRCLSSHVLHLTHVGVRTYDTGVLFAHYEPKRSTPDAHG
ncbi:MAG TPA: hypothetical protein VEL07_12585 [Planctomycetota bacterium]|nr:hypothetical protein [Planctomycetota bacterium]